MVSFSYANLQAPYLLMQKPGETFNRAEVFTHVEADLLVAEDDREIYSEVLFPVLELVTDLRKWQQTRGVFEFHSLDFDERWSVRILPVNDGWQIVNDENEEDIASSILTTSEVDQAINDFTEKLHQSCLELLGPWITEFFN